MPAPSCRIYPARRRNLWLATSASAGASRRVGMKSFDERCIRECERTFPSDFVRRETPCARRMRHGRKSIKRSRFHSKCSRSCELLPCGDPTLAGGTGLETDSIPTPSPFLHDIKHGGGRYRATDNKEPMRPADRCVVSAATRVRIC
jgi:hypothetical protein